MNENNNQSKGRNLPKYKEMVDEEEDGYGLRIKESPKSNAREVLKVEVVPI